MDVQVGVEILGTEGIDLASGVLRNVAVAQVLADHRPVLRFHQAVVVGMTRARLGAFDAQRVAHPGHLMVEILRAVVGVNAEDPEREAVQQRPDDRKQEGFGDLLAGRDQLPLRDAIDGVDGIDAPDRPDARCRPSGAGARRSPMGKFVPRVLVTSGRRTREPERWRRLYRWPTEIVARRA